MSWAISQEVTRSPRELSCDLRGAGIDGSRRFAAKRASHAANISSGETQSMSPKLTRRRFLGSLTTSASVAAIGGARAFLPVAHAATSNLPDPSSSGIDYIVLVMMENRSFDHFLGWLPDANGRQSGLTYLDKAGVPHPTYPMGDNQNCNLEDPDHSYAGGRAQYDAGACDGW